MHTQSLGLARKKPQGIRRVRRHFLNCDNEHAEADSCARALVPASSRTAPPPSAAEEAMFWQAGVCGGYVSLWRLRSMCKPLGFPGSVPHQRCPRDRGDGISNSNGKTVACLSANPCPAQASCSVWPEGRSLFCLDKGLLSFPRQGPGWQGRAEQDGASAASRPSSGRPPVRPALRSRSRCQGACDRDGLCRLLLCYGHRPPLTASSPPAP